MNEVKQFEPVKDPTLQEFETMAIRIAISNDDSLSAFKSLTSITQKLLVNDVTVKMLDISNPDIRRSLIGYEGVVDFLALLGYASDRWGSQLSLF